ncbi:unnamed protein product [Chondrus crispus]|uniref:Uncharacterized protein n=1 Tax=Chondrus crispus TaxID=2769 RepID=R7Q643_CHOCR|nr:unnamed protein product [Chondrus crispus]CDF32866.1 unnamed protein product [Chondrus crispus]|eukprot:XP_005712667.1 unnamed protein product [Chondrus crispus]
MPGAYCRAKELVLLIGRKLDHTGRPARKNRHIMTETLA